MLATLVKEYAFQSIEFVQNNVLISLFLLACLIGFITLYQIVIKVWVTMMWRKFLYGDLVVTYFHPISGLFYKNQRDKNTEDHLGHKMTVDHVIQNPKSKVLVSNFKSEVVYYLHDPDMIQQFLMVKRHHYYKESQHYQFLEDLFLKGISAVDGKEWKHLRKVSAPAFHFKLLANKIGDMKRNANMFISDIKKHNSERKSPKEYFDTYYHVLGLVGRNLISNLLGDEFIARHEEKYDILHEQDILVTKTIVAIAQESPLNYLRQFFYFNKPIRTIPSWLFSKSDKELQKRIDIYAGKIDSFIEERIQATKDGKPDAQDFLQFHINEFIKDENTKKDSDPTKMTVEIIRHQFTNMFTAGVGAPSSGMSNCLYHLALYPEWQEMIRKEMEENMDWDLDDDAMFQRISDLPLLDCFVKEVFRHFCPSSGLFHYRRAMQDHNLGEIKISKGNIVMINILGNSHNPNYFKNPNQFNPRRWQDDKEKMHPFQFIPFLGGLRNCIGQHMARLEIKLTMLMVMKQFKLEKTEVKYQTRFNLNLRMQDGRVINYIPIENPQVN